MTGEHRGVVPTNVIHKTMKRRKFCTLASASVLAAVGCDSGESEEGGSSVITIEGSTTVGPLVEDIIAIYAMENVNFDVVQSGSGEGVEAAGTRAVDIGMASRDLKADEFAMYPDLAPVAIARDAIVVSVHPDNPVSEISLEDLRRVWTGEITNWSELGGSDARIILAGRDLASGTRDFFEGFVLGDGDTIVDDKMEFASNDELRAFVQGEPAAMGYLGFGFISEGVKGFAFDNGAGGGAVTASVETVQSQQYTFVRGLFLLTHGGASDEVEAFVEFCLGTEAQAATRDAGFVPVY